MRLLIVVIICSMSSSLATAQTKEDFVDILEAIAEEPQADPLFQVELPRGRTMVLIRSLDRRNTQSARNAEQLFYDLLDEDLSFSAKPIRIMSQEEAGFHGADLRYCTTIGFRIGEEQVDLMLSSTIQGEEQLYQGAFTLRKEFGGWEITGRNVRSR